MPSYHSSVSSLALGGDDIPQHGLPVERLDDPGLQKSKMTQQVTVMTHYLLMTPWCSPWHILSKQHKFTQKNTKEKRRKLNLA